MTTVFDGRATEQVGRHARLELVFSLRRGRTVLAHSYAEPPFRAGQSFAEGSGLHMILASSAPGMFGGDLLEQSIVVEEGASVRLTSQSAPQLHASTHRFPAVVRTRYRVARQGRLSCHWDPMIPFAGAALEQTIAVDLAEDARLYWSDAIVSGREARGERWLFAALSHELSVSRGSVLAYLERFCVAPQGVPLAHPWVCADGNFFGTTIVAGSAHTMPVDAERLHRMLGAIEGVRGAADVVAESLLLVRMIGGSGVAFHKARAQVRDTITGTTCDAEAAGA